MHKKALPETYSIILTYQSGIFYTILADFFSENLVKLDALWENQALPVFCFPLK
jgi:hypothetical protein